MPVAGMPSSPRPLLTTKEEFDLRDELWRTKSQTRKEDIMKQLNEMHQVRLTTAKGQQTDL